VKIGVLGIGMGAHAAVLAAAERPEVVCLVLDSPYWSVSASFGRARLGGGKLARWLTPPASLLYGIVYGVRPEDESAARGLPRLADRDVLLLAPRDEETVAADVRGLYDALPEARQHDKNLILLAATRTTPLYDEDRARYDQVALTFFHSYLPVAPPVAAPAASPRHAPRR
jgi:pimeloyl-ACP methyl ester carboxylesterase